MLFHSEQTCRIWILQIRCSASGGATCLPSQVLHAQQQIHEGSQTEQQRLPGPPHLRLAARAGGCFTAVTITAPPVSSAVDTRQRPSPLASSTLVAAQARGGSGRCSHAARSRLRCGPVRAPGLRGERRQMSPASPEPCRREKSEKPRGLWPAPGAAGSERPRTALTASAAASQRSRYLSNLPAAAAKGPITAQGERNRREAPCMLGGRRRGRWGVDAAVGRGFVQPSCCRQGRASSCPVPTQAENSLRAYRGSRCPDSRRRRPRMSRHLARGPWETTAPSMPRGPGLPWPGGPSRRARAARGTGPSGSSRRAAPPRPVGHPGAAEEQTRRAGSAKGGSWGLSLPCSAIPWPGLLPFCHKAEKRKNTSGASYSFGMLTERLNLSQNKVTYI